LRRAHAHTIASPTSAPAARMTTTQGSVTRTWRV
jgi:hypothetical protein